MEPVGPTECFRLAVLDPGVPFITKTSPTSRLVYRDTRITATVTNDDVRLHATLGPATPLDNWGNWGGSIYPTGGYPTCQDRDAGAEGRPWWGQPGRRLRIDIFFQYPWERSHAYGFSKIKMRSLSLNCAMRHCFYAEEVADYEREHHPVAGPDPSGVGSGDSRAGVDRDKPQCTLGGRKW